MTTEKDIDDFAAALKAQLTNGTNPQRLGQLIYNKLRQDTLYKNEQAVGTSLWNLYNPQFLEAMK